MSRRKDAEDMVVFYIADHPFTAKDLGDDLLNMDIRKVFQEVIDRGMVPGIEPGSPWYEHLRMGGTERKDDDGGDLDYRRPAASEGELVGTLVAKRNEAEAELLATYTPEARAKVSEAQKRVRMARKLTAD